MRRMLLNLVAGAVVLGGGLTLTATSGSAASCSGPAGSNGCVCTSGDGLYTCRGDSCTSTATGCTATDHAVSTIEQGTKIESSAPVGQVSQSGR